MKVTFVLVCLAAIVTAAPTNQGLADDFQDFLSLLPLDEIISVGLDYLVNDGEVQEVLGYLQTKEFKTVWEEFFKVAEVRNVLNYLEEVGIPAYDTLNQVAQALGLPAIEKTSARLRRTGGLNGLLEEVLALLPLEKLKALFDDKLQTSPEFKALFDNLQHADFQQLVDFYNNSEEVRSFVQKLRDHGIDVDKILEVIKQFFGWGK